MDESTNNDKTLATKFELGYRPALDGLRGLAILAVMAFNAHVIWLSGGFVGVDVFFVLSGFLITALLIQNGRRTNGSGLKQFYIRRAARLFPALLVLIVCTFAYALLLQTGEKTAATLKGVLYSVFYVANWAQVPPFPGGIGPLSHTWSLSVEEQFYIVWPLLLLLLLKIKSDRAVLVIVSLLAALSVVLNIWFWNTNVPYLRMYFGSDTRANELLIGCIAAILLFAGYFQATTERLKWIWHSAAFISLAGIVTSFFLVRSYGPFGYNGGFALISVGTAVLILHVVLFPSVVSFGFGFAPLVWIGKISYGLYLWHFPIFEGLKRVIGEEANPLIFQVCGAALTFVVAAASFYLLEQPILRYVRRRSSDDANDRFFPIGPQTAETV